MAGCIQGMVGGPPGQPAPVLAKGCAYELMALRILCAFTKSKTPDAASLLRDRVPELFPGLVAMQKAEAESTGRGLAPVDPHSIQRLELIALLQAP